MITTPTIENSIKATSKTDLNISKTTTIKYFSIDLVGNIENLKEKKYIIDKIAPILISGFSKDTNLINKNELDHLIYTFGDNESIKSIIVLDQYGNKYDDFKLIGDNSIQISIDKSSAKNYNLTIKVTDIIENEKQINIDITSDIISPATTPSLIGGKFNSPISINLISSEESTIFYSTDGYPPIKDAPNTKSGKSPIVGIDMNLTTSLQFFAIDTAGNIEELKQEVYRFDDIEEPEFSLSAVYDKENKNVKLSWSSIDNSKKYNIFRVNNIIEKEILQHSKDSKYLAPNQYMLNNSKQNNYTDTNISNGAIYYYAVSVVNNQSIQGIISNIISVDIVPNTITTDINESISRAKNYLFSTQDKKGYWSKDDKLKILSTTEVLNALVEYKDENRLSFNTSTGHLYSTHANNNDFLARKIITLSKYNFYVDGLINKLIAQGYISSTYIYGWGMNKEYNVDTIDTILGSSAIKKANKSISKRDGSSYTLKNHIGFKSKDGYWSWVNKGDTSIYISSFVYKTINAKKMNING